MDGHKKLSGALHRLGSSSKGNTAIEYALIAGGIGVVIATAVLGVGADGLKPLYNSLLSRISQALS